MATFVDRFWAKVTRCESGCWEWQGELTHNGYGRLFVAYEPNRRCGSIRAHRLSWLVTYGPIPSGINILHECDNRRCVNPEHLFLGTQADNVADMDAKGRRPIRLNEAAVQDIRQRLIDGVTHAQLAREYGVSRSTIRSAVGRKRTRPSDRRDALTV